MNLIYLRGLRIKRRLAEATERAGFVPQYRGIVKQRRRCRNLQRDARWASPSSNMAQRLAQSRGRWTGPSFCVPRRAGKRQRQWHRIYSGATFICKKRREQERDINKINFL